MASQTPAPDAKLAGLSPEQELERGSRTRLEAQWRLSMSERLALMDELCCQMAALAGAAKSGE